MCQGLTLILKKFMFPSLYWLIWLKQLLGFHLYANAIEVLIVQCVDLELKFNTDRWKGI